jgi:broad specificity phosphatase PhoE
MSRLIIARHAETAFNLQNRIQGHSDSELTPKGLRQAKRLAARLKKLKIDKIYTSDLGRAFATTAEIAKHTRVPIVQDPKLREIFLGAWEGMTPKEVDEMYNKGYQRWLKKPTASASRAASARSQRPIKERRCSSSPTAE